MKKQTWAVSTRVKFILWLTLTALAWAQPAANYDEAAMPPYVWERLLDFADQNWRTSE